MGDRRFKFQELRDQEILDFGDGYRAKNSELDGEGLVFLRAAYLQDVGFVLSEPDRFKDMSADKFGPKVAQLGDVVITTKGNSTGRIGVIREPETGSVYSPHLSYWRSLRRDFLDQRYLYYWSRSADFRHQLSSLAYATDMAPYLSLRDQATISLPIPPIHKQRIAASTLGALDDKIELNRRMNETLEAMARAIFKDWFVDFGPTRAKAEGRAPYLAPEIWDLFPDALDDEDKPIGWTSRPMMSLASITKGRSYKSEELQESSVALVTLKSFKRGGGYRQDGLKPYTGTYKPEQAITPGELVMALTDVTQAADVIGKPAIVSKDDKYETLVASLDVGIIRPLTHNIGTEFLWCLMLTDRFRDHIYSHCTGTTVLHLSKEALPSFDIVLSSAELLFAFQRVVKAIVRQMARNGEQSKTLAQTRDLLLPKLLSGEISLAEAAKVVEAAA